MTISNELKSLFDKGTFLLSRAYHNLYKQSNPPQQNAERVHNTDGVDNIIENEHTYNGLPQHLINNFRTLDISGKKKLRAAIFEYYYEFASEEDFYNDSLRLTKAEKEYILNTDLPAQMFDRMTATRKRIIPWLDDQITLLDKNILEIGAGTGCSAVALAEQCTRMTGVDIQEKDLALAKIRSNLYQIQNIDFINKNAIQVFDGLEHKKYNVVIFYACLEHMTMDERIISLAKAWNYLDFGDYLIIIESPNRLFWYDYHTSFLPFFHMLPYDLALRYAKYSTRASLAKSLEGLSKEDAFTRLSRWGMGFGYHEIEVALERSVLSLKFLEDLISFEIRTTGFSWEEDALTRKTFQRLFEIRNIEMPHIGFFNINIDIILKK